MRPWDPFGFLKGTKLINILRSFVNKKRILFDQTPFAVKMKYEYEEHPRVKLSNAIHKFKKPNSMNDIKMVFFMTM